MPLTKLMVEKLKDCKKMQDESDDLCLPKHFGASFPGLYKRKLVDVRTSTLNGKEIVCVYITNLGLEYLSAEEELK